MLRFLGLLVLLGLAFGLGYVMGQLPLHPLTEKVRELSRHVMDTTLGVERDLRRRQGLVEAKARLVQAKVHLVDRNYGQAGKELGEAIDAFEQAIQGTRDSSGADKIRVLMGQVREMKLELAMGKKVALATLDDLQRSLDTMLQH